MSSWLILAKGPAFFFTITVFVLGLLRLTAITVWDIITAVQRAGDQRMPYSRIATQTLTWLVPLTRLYRARLVYSLASFGLHLGILFVALFLRNHLDILQSNLGFAWFSIPKWMLDILTLLGIAGASILLLSRIYVSSSRFLSRASDYLLLLLLLNIFLSGFIAGRAWNPIPYDGLMLFHTLNGMALLLLSPFTKIAHCVLFPLIRFGSEVAWHFIPHGGSHVVQTLHGPQGRKV
jgi:nitrate reductase gamma subunit